MKNVEIVITSNRIPELKKRFPQLVSAIVDKTAFDLQKVALESMQGPKSGRMYKRGKKGIHKASAPGEAPAMDTGNLSTNLIVTKESESVAIVGTNVEYAAALEFGTADGKIAARPFLTPAADKVRPKFLQALLQLENRLK